MAWRPLSREKPQILRERIVRETVGGDQLGQCKRRDLSVVVAARGYNYVAMMRELCGAGPAKTECGEQSKLTTKVPSAICRKGRTC